MTRSGRFLPFLAVAVVTAWSCAGSTDSPTAPGAPSAGGVQGSGSDAKVVSSPSASPSASPSPGQGAETEFRGRVESVTPPTLRVAGRNVVTDAETRIRRRGDPIPLTAIQPGDLVEVEGRQQADGTLLASKVTLEDDDDEGEDELEFLGRVDSVTPPTLRVAGRSVVTNASTRIRRRGDPIPLSAIRPGDLVEVEGRQESDGTVLASKVTLEDGDDEGDDDPGDDDHGGGDDDHDDDDGDDDN